MYMCVSHMRPADAWKMLMLCPEGYVCIFGLASHLLWVCPRLAATADNPLWAWSVKRVGLVGAQQPLPPSPTLAARARVERAECVALSCTQSTAHCTEWHPMPLRGVDREGVQGVTSEVEADWLLRTLRSVTCTSLVASSDFYLWQELKHWTSSRCIIE